MTDRTPIEFLDPEALAAGNYLLSVTGTGAAKKFTVVADTAAGITVQDENANVATGVTQIDFQGAGVSATAGTGEVVVTIAGANLRPLTTELNGVPDLVWDDNNNLVYAEAPA